MQRFVLAVLVAAGLLAPGAGAQRIAKRQHAQQQRIRQGVRSGELTRRETVKLEKKEVRLNREIRRDRRDGGGLTPHERVKIEKKQNKLSRDIYREKHDNQQRPH